MYAIGYLHGHCDTFRGGSSLSQLREFRPTNDSFVTIRIDSEFVPTPTEYNP